MKAIIPQIIERLKYLEENIAIIEESICTLSKVENMDDFVGRLIKRSFELMDEEEKLKAALEALS